ncbi:hypothetical protein CJ469_04863 [Nocardia farcinica]|nr:hypothetical protein CJ469_04863 [Nocardia farcinica]PFX06288.1 hypothetical protein CJ468_04678 [Nocardia farcinica]
MYTSNDHPRMKEMPWPSGFGPAGRGRTVFFTMVPFLSVMAITGFAMSASGVRQGDFTLAVFGLLSALFALSFIPVAIRIYRSRRRSLPHLRIREMSHGETAVSIPRWRWFSTITAVMLVTAIAAAGYYAYTLASKDPSTPQTIVRGPMAPILLIVAASIAVWLMIRLAYTAGKEKGLWLSPSGLRVSNGLMCQSVDWVNVVAVDAAAQPRFATIKVASRPGTIDLVWASMWARKKSRFWLVEVYTLEFDMDSALLYHLIYFYWKHPDLRAELASDAVMARVRSGQVLDQTG